MTYQNVRTAVAGWITNSVDGINVVYRAYPLRIDAKDVFGGSGSQTGLAAVVHIGRSLEYRVTSPRVTGWKRTVYDVDIALLFRSLKTTADIGEHDPAEGAQDVLDVAVDNLKARLHADPTLGGLVYSAGEGADQRAPDFEIQAGYPFISDKGAAIHIWTYLKLVVSEWYHA